MSLFPRFLAHLFPSTPPDLVPEQRAQAEAVRSALPEVTVIRSDQIPRDQLEELRHVPLDQWHAHVHARHVAEEWAAGLTDEALAAWVGGVR